jgi:hypothetical protein
MPRKHQRFHGGYDFDFGFSRKYRKLLNTPIRLRGVSVEQREQVAAQAAQARIDAAFKLYGIPEDTPEVARWMTLAIRLLGEHFKGCRSLVRQPGGSPKLVSDGEYIKLAEDFDGAAPRNRKLTDLTRANNYLKSCNGEVKVGRETIRTARSLIRAVKRGRKLNKVEP